jgi:tRNA nucleotidyltransferase/poly(A) polymerase
MQKNVSYTAVVLDDKSRESLRKEFNSWSGAFPDGWEWIAHHMTIKLGALPDDVRNELVGKKVTLTINKIGSDDMVMAVGVTGFYSEKKIPHITLAVNRADGGKPKMSNDLVDWKPYSVDFELTGTVEECSQAVEEKKSLTEGYDVKKLPFYGDVTSVGGKIYQVGGAVRDLYLGKASKDLDILVTGVPADKLNNILNKYGKVDMVGASFGVIKFTPPGGEEIDIAIPRTEKLKSQDDIDKKIIAIKNAMYKLRPGDDYVKKTFELNAQLQALQKEKINGHKAFDVNADHTLPIEKDLERRDFTINSIAKDSEGNIIDPFGGVKDLGAKVIRLTNPQAFADDPLRMLRAVQFASRFDFKIDPATFKMIQKNAHSISEISKERILIEFDKIVHKGNPTVGAELLVSSGLYEGIFGVEFTGDLAHFAYVKRMSEFIYWLTESFTDQPDQYFKHEMKGEIDVTREIAALSYLYQNLPGNDIIKQRWVYYHINRIAPVMLESDYVKSLLNDVVDDFKSGRYPVSLSKLAVNGNDMMKIGLKGKDVGEALMKIMGAIYSDNLKNDASVIMHYIQKKETLNENIDTKEQKKVVFYDFDGTIMDSPLPDPGMTVFAQKTGKPYPHKGWWGRDESLFYVDENGKFIDIYDIQPNPDVLKEYRKDAADPNTKVVLLTNRIPKNELAIKHALKKHGIVFDAYSFKKDHKGKGERIWDIMKGYYPDYKSFEFYDDDPKHLQSVHDNFIDEDYDYHVYHVVDGKIIR